MEKDEKKMDSKTKEVGISRHRSPAFPLISFEDALGRLKVIYSKDKRASINVDTLISHLGYKGGRAGTSGRVVAALKQYNLLDEKASQFKVSDTGFKIIELPEGSEEQKSLIKESALAPAIFQRLLAHYNDDLPSDENLSSHLKINEKFNPDSVSHFIKIFRANVDLVKFLGGSKNTKTHDIQTDEKTKNLGAENSEKFTEEKNFNLSSKQSNILFEYSVPLSIQREVNAFLRIEGQELKKRDLVILSKKVKDLIDAFDEDDDLIMRKEAIWHNKDFDIPVVLISQPQKGDDGREYVAIEGSNSRIPFDEITLQE